MVDPLGGGGGGRGVQTPPITPAVVFYYLFGSEILWRIKLYLRNRMSQEWLSGLALMHLHHDLN